MPAELDASDIQSLILAGHGGLKGARFIRMTVTRGQRGTALDSLRELLDRGLVTFGVPADCAPALQIAFTAKGLSKLGLDPEVVGAFPRVFRDGMDARARQLGDRGSDAPGHWKWGSGNEVPDAVSFVYGADDGVAATRADELEALAAGWTCQRLEDPLWLGKDKPREHFGFIDGIANPVIRGGPRDGDRAQPENVVAAGEFLLGHPDETGRLAPSPKVAPGGSRGVVLPDGDFGRNGSYLVMRQIGQRVREFAGFLAGAAQSSEKAEWIAAKMVGRWPSGAPLARWSQNDPGSGAADDHFLYRGDPQGLSCPLGAHIRRINPRDAMPGIEDPRASVASSNRRRLLRAGRTYGSPYPGFPSLSAMADHDDNGELRGLHFLCFCADIESQFEFVQRSWLISPSLGTLTDDPDPLVAAPRDGATHGFTIQRRAASRRVTGLGRFTDVLGGAYLFMPGRSALRYLAGASAT